MTALWYKSHWFGFDLKAVFLLRLSNYFLRFDPGMWFLYFHTSFERFLPMSVSNSMFIFLELSNWLLCGVHYLNSYCDQPNCGKVLLC